MLNRRRKTTVLVSLLAVGALVPAVPASAVIGGSVSTYGPWAVRILVDGNAECTGTVVDREWVLSASHCFFEQGEPIADSRIEFRVGNLDQRKGISVRPVKDGRRGSPVADMMLVKVPPMEVTPAKLPAANVVRPGQAVRQYGWGATCTGDENACQSDVLKQSDLRVLDPADKRCEGFAAPDGTDFCAVSVSGVPAGGDSGGPVMAVSPGRRDTLVGVLSGSDRSEIAGMGDVSKQLSWISATIRA